MVFESNWLSVHMEDIEHGRPIQFITERRITEGYHKTKDRWNRSTIEADDNRRPLEIGGVCEN